MRDAVERRVIIIGEAINKLYAADLGMGERLEGYRSAIDRRNGLAHEYDKETLVSQIWNAHKFSTPSSVWKSRRC